MPNNPSTNRIYDNDLYGRAGDYLQQKITTGAELSIVSAYFTIFAHQALEEKLANTRHTRFLFGEPRFIDSVDPEKDEGKVFKIENDSLALEKQLTQRAVAKACADWIREKVDIRSICQKNLLHGKLYHIKNGTECDALLGSSNFTLSGMGYGNTPNIELNMEVDSKQELKDLLYWFDKLWTDNNRTRDVKSDVLDYLAKLYKEHSPQLIYFKTLFHIFESILDEQKHADDQLKQSSLLESEIWKALFDFQKDGVKGAINKILAHNGCILADSVGLGKTFEALAIIKYFEQRNNRVLVLCPKKLRENWITYRRNDVLNPFLKDRFDFDVLSHTDLGRSSGKVGHLDLSRIDWSVYGLVVIDESHNFRNNASGRKDEDGNVKKSRYAHLMDDILTSGIQTKVLLLSATPVNNTLRDLRNQLYLISENNDAAFTSIGISSLEKTLAVAQKQFSAWTKKPETQRKTRDLLNSLTSSFFTLLDQLTIARSRKHIQRHYAQSLAHIGGFPKREKPDAIYPEIDKKGRFMSYDTLNDQISKYQLSLYNPAEFVKPEFKPLYEKSTAGGHFNQAGREKLLIGMMKVGFLKRLESSVHSFALTMERTDEKIIALENRIKDYIQKEKQSSPSEENGPDDEIILDELPLDSTGDDPDDLDAFEVGKRLKYKLKHLDLEKWQEALSNDKQQIFMLYSQARSVQPEDDAKLDELKKLIAQKQTHPSTTKDGAPNKKVLIFTAFSDTATYLYNNIHKWATEQFGAHSALVTGSKENRSTYGSTDFEHILTHFSPVSKKRDKQPQLPSDSSIDILIATDCISEGQNLQDCDYLINYDIHWNPVRIIQRFGRIDRIGSINHSVKLVNFWPTSHLEKYISLKSRVEARMALVDLAATAEDNLLANDDMEELIKTDLHYRDKQLLRLRDEVLDLEDLQEDGLTLSEFTLEDFRTELLHYLEANRDLLKNTPLGLNAIVPANPSQNILPGTIFCLRQNLKNSTEKTDINPLQPHYLVYVHDDGNIRLTFAQPKQILEILRSLCSNQSAAIQALCDIFNKETDNGAQMDKYSALLKNSIKSIAATFRRRAGAVLTSSRDALLIPKSEQPTEQPHDFELITWVVIK